MNKAKGGRPRIWPFADMRVGDRIIVTGRHSRICDAVRYVRRSRGWSLRQRKCGVGVEVVRHA